MSYWGMSKRLYADHKAPDGMIATGWRYVKKGGRVKIGGSYFANEKLKEIVGEYVHVQMADYWMQEVGIYRGAFDCSCWFCDAKACAK